MSAKQPVDPSASDTSRAKNTRDFSPLTQDDIYLFNEGSHFRLYEKLGARPVDDGRLKGVYFAVWAPNAGRVSVIGDFNGWDSRSHPLRSRESSRDLKQVDFTNTISNPDSTAIRPTKPIRSPSLIKLPRKRLPLPGIWIIPGMIRPG